jgi:hypothetical protein
MPTLYNTFKLANLPYLRLPNWLLASNRWHAFGESKSAGVLGCQLSCPSSIFKHELNIGMNIL